MKEYDDNEQELQTDEVSIHREALRRRQASIDANEQQRRQVLEDILFTWVEDRQWDEYAIRNRGKRPRYTINLVKGAVSQVMGEMKQNRIDIKVQPRSGGSNPETADLINGLIRSIEKNNNFDSIGESAAKEAFTGGFGAWQVCTDYKDQESFDNSLDIKIKPIRSACTCAWPDPASTDEFHRDASFWVIDEDISKAEHKKRWPNKKCDSLEVFEGGVGDLQERETVRIADYWKKTPIRKKIAEFNDGSIKELDADLISALDELQEQGIYIAEDEQGKQKIKEIDSYKVEHYKINGSEILEGPHEWDGSIIPVVPLYGSQMWVDGQHYYSGLVRFAKDPARLYNYITSSKVEETAVSIGNKTVFTRQMIAGNEEYIENPDPNTPLVINPDPRVAGGLPVKLGTNPMNSALIEQANQAHQDVQKTLGVFDQALGNNPRQQSGKALLAQRQNMQTGTFEMHDNFAKAKTFTGEILIDTIPHVMDVERQERIINEDGDAKVVSLNKMVYDDELQKWTIVENDITVGKYDVISDVGPSYKTQRDEAVEQMAFISQTNPELLGPYAAVVMLESSGVPSIRKIGEAVRMDLVRQGRLEPNEREAKVLAEEQKQKAEAGPDPQEIAMQLELEKLKNENTKLAAEARRMAAEAYKEEMGIETQPRQEELENLKMVAQIDKDEAQAAKLKRDADEPYQKQQGDRS